MPRPSREGPTTLPIERENYQFGRTAGLDSQGKDILWRDFLIYQGEDGAIGMQLASGSQAWDTVAGRKGLSFSDERQLETALAQQHVIIDIEPRSQWIPFGEKGRREQIAIEGSTALSVTFGEEAATIESSDGDTCALTATSGDIYLVKGTSTALVISKAGDTDYLVPARILLDTPDRPIQKIELERLQSKGAMRRRLREDFPWIDLQDIFNVGDYDDETTWEVHGLIPIQEFERDLGTVDLTRIKQIYPAERINELVGTPPTDVEILYVAARNYLRIVELAQLADKSFFPFRDLPKEDRQKKIAEILASMGPQKRRELAITFLDEAESRLQKLLEARRRREIELFGMEIEDPLTQRRRRFVSGDTIDTSPSILGRAFVDGTEALVTDAEYGFADDPDVYHRRMLEVLTEATSHEMAHRGAPKTTYTERTRPLIEPPAAIAAGPLRRTDTREWDWEEILTDWYSRYYPLHLRGRGEAPALSTKYEHPAGSLEPGGVIEIHEIFLEMTSAAQQGSLTLDGRRISPEDVERSLIATKILRDGYGTLVLAGQSVLGFFELYNRTHADSTFEGRLSGCRDSDYADSTMRIGSRPSMIQYLVVLRDAILSKIEEQNITVVI